MARGGMTNQLLVVQLQGPTHSTDITGTITFRPLHLRRGAKGRGDEKLHDARLRIRPPATNRPSPPLLPSKLNAPKLERILEVSPREIILPNERRIRYTEREREREVDPRICKCLARDHQRRFARGTFDTSCTKTASNSGTVGEKIF